MTALHHIALRAVDFDATVRFYRDAFGYGAPRVWSYPPHVEKAAFLPAPDGSWLEIFADGVASSWEEPKEGLVHFALHVDDVDEGYERALAAGATTIAPPASFTIAGNPGWDVRLAFVQGLCGERIEIYRTTIEP